MKMRRRRSTFPRFDWRRSIDNSEPLKGQLWTRSEKSLQEPDVHWFRRAAAGGVAVVEAALLLWLLLGPATAIRSVEVHGANHMTSAQVMKAAGLDQSGSILAVDPSAERQKLLGQTWIRTASVQPMLNGTVRIDISEWQPIAVYHAGASGALFLMSDQAVLLGPAPSAGLLVNIQGPSNRDSKVGDRLWCQVEQVGHAGQVLFRTAQDKMAGNIACHVDMHGYPKEVSGDRGKRHGQSCEDSLDRLQPGLIRFFRAGDAKPQK